MVDSDAETEGDELVGRLGWRRRTRGKKDRDGVYGPNGARVCGADRRVPEAGVWLGVAAFQQKQESSLRAWPLRISPTRLFACVGFPHRSYWGFLGGT